MEGNFEVGNDMIEETNCIHVLCFVEGGHGFYPFGKVVDNNYNMFVPIVGWGVASHEINAPLTERVDIDDWMEKGRWCSGFVCI
jgi:hypothetical protein